MSAKRNRETFAVQILSQQHSTWQGTVSWTSQQKTQPFRSTLELIKMIDSALDESNISGAEPELKDED